MQKSVAAAVALRSAARYELGNLLARGGMGAVYRAHDKLAEREVAYKRLVVPENRSRARFVGLFQREYDTLTQLQHPSIVRAYEYGFDDQGPFYTMELLEGQGLMELAPLPPREVCRILRDVASALALLHARRLLHRDLSPSNVRINGASRTKLIDFGALIPFGQAPDIVGTPAFMAPETLERGRELDQRADLYALGALAYWALTRKTPVQARLLDELPRALLEPIEPPSRHVELPPALDELVMSLLARNPLARPESAAEVMERLTTIAELEPEPDEASVAASYLANPKLVGRAAMLAQLELSLPASGTSGASFVICAEQGQGRSALLHQLTVSAQLAGATVLRAEAPLDPVPFGLARALLRTALALYPDLLGSGEPKDSHFEQLLQPRRLTVVEAAPWSPVNASERQARTLALMQKLLLSACDRHPTAILVDDLQRADAESLALLAALAAEVPRHSLLLVVSVDKRVAASD
ncbi:MAG TPA: serine/threonine-protein kinase, partial [Polyangiaceae bacterium]|nr:serine/threonine-protein kinase [Polyangiaceae bacterium]